MPATDAPLNAVDYERRAAAVLEAGVFDWFAGGAGDEQTLRANTAAFRRFRLRPRVLVDVEHVTPATTVLGHELALPILVAPTAFQRLVHPDGELAMARGAAAAGTVMCVSTMATASFADISAAAPGAARWLQVYHFTDRGRTRALIDAGRDAGASAIVLTVDAPVRGRRERELGAGFRMPAIGSVPNVAAAMAGAPAPSLEELIARTLTWRDLDWLVSETGLPVLLKGILTREDAELACEAGVAGVIVSNHGGRQLDGVDAGIDALGEVVEAVAGRAEVLVDGGVRRGMDAIVALALGARAVLVGRPLVWALAVGGEDGVAHLLGLLRDEVTTALTLLGCPDPGALSRAHVKRADRSY
jgi:isopentenyl diphosphate isomerase/L-lactate dehydrogenase-like FMN-dependent dehydrogenase